MLFLLLLPVVNGSDVCRKLSLASNNPKLCKPLCDQALSLFKDLNGLKRSSLDSFHDRALEVLPENLEDSESGLQRLLPACQRSEILSLCDLAFIDDEPCQSSCKAVGYFGNFKSLNDTLTQLQTSFPSCHHRLADFTTPTRSPTSSAAPLFTTQSRLTTARPSPSKTSRATTQTTAGTSSEITSTPIPYANAHGEEGTNNCVDVAQWEAQQAEEQRGRANAGSAPTSVTDPRAERASAEDLRADELPLAPPPPPGAGEGISENTGLLESAVGEDYMGSVYDPGPPEHLVLDLVFRCQDNMKSRKAQYIGTCKLRCFYLAKRGPYLTCPRIIREMQDFIDCFNFVAEGECTLS